MKNKDDIKKFSDIIENIVQDKSLSYMDAILHHSEETGFELELVPQVINSNIKAHLKQEAEVLNFLKRKAPKIPL